MAFEEIGGSSVEVPLAYKGTCDAGMSASTTTIVSADLAGYGDDFFNGKYWLTVLKNDNSVGNAPEQEYRKVTDYVSATGTLTVDAFTANVEASDIVMLVHESIPFLKVVEFTSGSGNWTVPAGVYMVDVLIVGGGGGGGGIAGDGSNNNAGGGGGGGEVVAIKDYRVVPAASLAYSVGAGGAGGAAGNNAGQIGVLSSFNGIVAYPGLGGNGAPADGTLANGGNGGQTAVTGGAGGVGGAGARGTSFGGASCMVRIGGGGGGAGSYAGGDSVSPGGTGIYTRGGGSYGPGANSPAGTNLAGVDALDNSGGGGSGARGFNQVINLAGGNGGSGYIRITYR